MAVHGSDTIKQYNMLWPQLWPRGQI